MVIRRIGPRSAAKLVAAFHAVFGLLAGLLVALAWALGPEWGIPTLGGAAVASLGLGAILFLPMVYGLVGLLVGLLGAHLYNAIAGVVGGLVLEVE